MSATKDRILIVEHNEVTRKLLSGLLSSKGFETLEASNGDAALGFMAGKPPSLVMLDMGMDEMSLSGFLLRMNESYGHVPLVIMTEESDTEALGRKYGLKDFSVLKKPFVPDSLLGKIEKHFLKTVEDGLAIEKRIRRHAPDEADPSVRARREEIMRRAMDIAQRTMDAGQGGPFAAVVTRAGKIVAEGWDAVLAEKDPTQRAEVMAISKAAKALNTFDLSGCEIYTVCEPCPLGMAAIYRAHIDRVFYACTIEDALNAGFDFEYLYRELAQPEHKRGLPAKMVLHDEARIVFDNWLKRGDRMVY